MYGNNFNRLSQTSVTSSAFPPKFVLVWSKIHFFPDLKKISLKCLSEFIPFINNRGKKGISADVSSTIETFNFT